jgi:hypothetical protein
MPGTLLKRNKVNVAAAVGVVACALITRAGSATSNEAHEVQQATMAFADFSEQSEALFGEKSAALSQLYELAGECAVPDWDGENASAISGQAVQTAADFIRALPEGIPLPEFAPEPDGAISLDWIQSPHRQFSLSIGANDRLAYAWLDGTDKGHGVARFDGANIPSKIINGIVETLNDKSTFLRAA